jgi:protein-tyrosine phosphatase
MKLSRKFPFLKFSQKDDDSNDANSTSITAYENAQVKLTCVIPPFIRTEDGSILKGYSEDFAYSVTETESTRFLFPSQILPYLFLGNKFASSSRTREKFGITHVLSVESTCRYPLHENDYKFLHVPLSDFGRSNLEDEITGALDFIDSVRYIEVDSENVSNVSENARELRPNKKILVHCTAGVNRSPSVVIAYLMVKCGLTLRESYMHVLECRHQISPHELYFEQLQEWERKLYGYVSLTREHIGPSLQAQMKEIMQQDFGDVHLEDNQIFVDDSSTMTNHGDSSSIDSH